MITIPLGLTHAVFQNALTRLRANYTLHGMKIERVRELLHGSPFLPFWIYLADGGRIGVEHEDFVALAPTGREIQVYQPDGSSQFLDMMLVTRIEVKARNGVTAHRRKK